MGAVGYQNELSTNVDSTANNPFDLAISLTGRPGSAMFHVYVFFLLLPVQVCDFPHIMLKHAECYHATHFFLAKTSLPGSVDLSYHSRFIAELTPQGKY
jgi:hypothetical protein